MKLPEDFPLDDISEFKFQSLDLRSFNDGNGVSFAQLNELLAINIEAIEPLLKKGDEYTDEGEYIKSMYGEIKKYFATSGSDPGNNYFLSTYRSLHNKVACVYGVVKDT